MNESPETITKPEAGQTLSPTTCYTVGRRVKKGSHTGTVTGKTGKWYHIDWDGGWKPRSNNYYGAWEFEAAQKQQLVWVVKVQKIQELNISVEASNEEDAQERAVLMAKDCIGCSDTDQFSIARIGVVEGSNR